MCAYYIYARVSALGADVIDAFGICGIRFFGLWMGGFFGIEGLGGVRMGDLEKTISNVE